MLRLHCFGLCVCMDTLFALFDLWLVYGVIVGFGVDWCLTMVVLLVVCCFVDCVWICWWLVWCSLWFVCSAVSLWFWWFYFGCCACSGLFACLLLIVLLCFVGFYLIVWLIRLGLVDLVLLPFTCGDCCW